MVFYFWCSWILRVLQWFWYAEAFGAFSVDWIQVRITGFGCTSWGPSRPVQGVRCKTGQVWFLVNEKSSLTRKSLSVMSVKLSISNEFIAGWRCSVALCTAKSDLAAWSWYVFLSLIVAWLCAVPSRPAGEVQTVGRLALQSLCAPQCVQSCTVCNLNPSVVTFWLLHVSFCYVSSSVSPSKNFL